MNEAVLSGVSGVVVIDSVGDLAEERRETKARFESERTES